MVFPVVFRHRLDLTRISRTLFWINAGSAFIKIKIKLSLALVGRLRYLAASHFFLGAFLL